MLNTTTMRVQCANVCVQMLTYTQINTHTDTGTHAHNDNEMKIRCYIQCSNEHYSADMNLR